MLALLMISGGSAPQSEKLWRKANEVKYKSPAELKTQHEKEIRAGVQFKKIIWGNPANKAVALTIDDGPHEIFTPQILKILKKYNIKATFFVVGKMAEANPELIRAEAADGHTIGNHTYSHPNLKQLHSDDIKAELLACNYIVKSILGLDMKYFRPPGGDYNYRVVNAMTEEDFTMVLWTDDPGDYLNPGKENIENRVLARIENGGIILLHDGYQQTIDVLPQIIEHLKSRGFRFQTIEEMGKRG